MNKDTIIGFILIALVLIGFSWWNQPSAEQIEAAKKQDSIEAVMKEQAEKGIQGGLQMVKFTDIMCSNLFISKNEGAAELGVTNDDIDGAIGDSILLCREIIENKKTVVEMKGE